jgi:hypothetical protein
MAISDEITRLQNAKIQIKTAIENKGGTVPEETTLDGYAALIDELSGGGGNYQSKSVVPSKDYQVVKPDEGYDALSSVLVAETPLEEKTVDPTTAGFIVEPEGDNIGLSKVTVMGDHNLISSNIRSGVRIFDVTGSFEGGSTSPEDFSDIGHTVSVEAKTSFYAGERFVGVKNDSYLTPTMSSLALGITSIIDASEDLSVAVPSQTITATSTTITIGFLNDQNAYELVDVALPSAVSSITSNLTLAASNCTVNEDGSLIAIGGLMTNEGSKNTSNVITIETSIGSKTATASWQGALDYGYKSDYADYTAWAYGSPTVMILTKNYLLCTMAVAYQYTKADGTIASGTNIGGGAIFYYNGNSFSQAIYKSPSNISYSNSDIWDKNCVAWADDSTLITISRYLNSFNYQIRKFVLNGSTIVSMANRGMGVWSTDNYGGTQYAISGNARYIARADRIASDRTTEYVWSFHSVDLSTTQIGYRSNNYKESGYTSYKLIPDSTGEFVYNTNKKQIRRITDLATNVYNGGGGMSSKHFDIMNGMFYRDGVNKRFLSPRSQEAEYLITSTGAAITTEDRIYGIVPKAMLMGEIGTARGLFRT